MMVVLLRTIHRPALPPARRVFLLLLRAIHRPALPPSRRVLQAAATPPSLPSDVPVLAPWSLAPWPLTGMRASSLATVMSASSPFVPLPPSFLSFPLRGSFHCLGLRLRLLRRDNIRASLEQIL